MADLDAIRALALALPEAVAGDDHGTPAATVRGKIFCVFNADPARLTLKLDPEDQRNLSEGHVGVVSPVEGYWGRKGWTRVDSAAADDALVETLLNLAWAAVAPKRLRKA